MTSQEMMSCLAGGDGRWPRALNYQDSVLASRLTAVAVAACEPVALHPGDEAMIPAVWDSPIPGDDFLAEGADEGLGQEGLECLPGVMPGGVTEVMVCVRNTTTEVMTVEGGSPLLKARDTVGDLAPPAEDGTSEVKAKAFVKRSDYRDASLRKALDPSHFKTNHLVPG